MHCPLRRTYKNSHKIADGEKSIVLREPQEENNSSTSSKDCEEVSPLVWRNPDYRCTLLTFLTLNPDGRWRVVAMPLQCPGRMFQLQPAAQVKMEGHAWVSAASVSSDKVGRAKARSGYLSDRSSSVKPDRSSSVKPFTATSFARSSFQLSSRNEGVAVNFSELIASGSNATNSSDICMDVPKVDKAVKTNPRKKTRRNWKRNKKLSCDTGSSTELECAHGSCTSESGVDKNICDGVEQLQSATKLAVETPVGCISGNARSAELAKRGKKTKTAAQNSSINRDGSVGNLNGRSAKENNHSFWQKVRRNDTDECTHDLNSVNSLCPSSDIGSREAPCNDVESNMLSNDEEKSRSKVELSRKFRRKTRILESRSKQEYNFSSRKGSHNSKASVNDGMKINRQQKWIPVDINESVQTSSCLSTYNPAKSAAESVTSGNVGERKFASDSRILSPSMSGKAMRPFQVSEDENGLPSEADDQTRKLTSQSTCTPKLNCTDHSSAKCLFREYKDQDKLGSDNDSNQIAKAIYDAYMAQLSSEAVEITMGCPIAEFERLLDAASPIVSVPNKIISCRTCSHDKAVTASLCGHEKPSISLGSLWQWYEKHGSYGLEVKAEEYENSKRLGIDNFKFCAYFVPFLSAVQLFIDHERISSHKKGVPDTAAVEACERDEKDKSSTNIGSLPIFQVFVPLPRSEDTKFLPPRNPVCCSELSSRCIKENVVTQPLDTAYEDDMELLFEYFEVEQPQQRRPLFDMIKELIRGDGPSRGRAYGDPTTLDSVDIHDLHPKSWYSVAWYPIYRIPDGNFRAAFLTYHSLGHLVHRSSGTSDTFGMDTLIVSPVVGLQSYNAQGECWFRLRHSAPGQINPPCGILKERLRTLEQTASLMARAVVTKGNVTCVNRQPDYEFFLSRQR